MAVIHGDPSRPENINALAGNLQLLLIRFHLSSGVILGSENFVFLSTKPGWHRQEFEGQKDGSHPW